MASANRHRKVRSQLPTCYHEGFLEKKSIKDRMGRKLWTSLCGNSLFFFNNTKDSVYVEKLELTDLVTVSDDCCRDRNLNAAGFTLQMKNEDIKMIAPSLEARELWKGFLLSISKLTVPTSLNLLPGQIHMMKEIIEKEKKRQRLLSFSAPSQDDYVIAVPEMPMCYFPVNRLEAEILLERNSGRGNLLLRRRQDGSFALTTRQDINGIVFKHYCVSRRPEGGFSIALENPITCATLHDVVNYLVEMSSGVFVPLEMEQHYEEHITIVKSNEENGEITEHCLRNNPSPIPPIPPPKPVTRNVLSMSEQNSVESEYLNFSNTGEVETDQTTFKRPPVLPRPPARRYLPHQNSMFEDQNPSSDGDRKPLVPPGYSKTPSRSNSFNLPENCSTHEQRVDMNELQNAIKRRAIPE